MNLWLLRPRSDLPQDNDPWYPWFYPKPNNKIFGFVVRAEDERAARELANRNAKNENCGKAVNRTMTPWLESEFSTCVNLTPDGPAEVIIWANSGACTH